MSEQLSLPYFEITKVANRDYLRKNFKQSARASYFTPFSEIKERDNFNNRIVYEEIPELAESIFLHGLKEPLVLDVLPTGECYIDEGARRIRAMRLLIEQKREGWTENTLIEFFPNKAEVTELDRLVNQYTSNNHKKKFKPFEQAEVAWEVKHNFSEKPKSHEDIAEIMGISRQKVDNLIAIASATDDLKNSMVTGNMTMMECLNLAKSKSKAEKQADKAEMDANKNGSAAPQEQKDELAGEMKELEELEKETDEERDQRLLRESTKREQAKEQLMAISDEIKVRKETITEHEGRKLSAPILRTWTEDFVDEDTSEVVSIERNQVIVPQNETLTDGVIETILLSDVDTILVYKKGMEPAAKSVVTVMPGGDDGTVKYDMGRPEIEKIQKAIQAGDKIEAIVNKLDVPEQTKNDIAYQVHWLIENLVFVRDWVHTNKKQNKRGS